MICENLSELYDACTLCPNGCRVNRNNGEAGICGQTSQVKIAWSGLHKGEEPPISGKNGSGMIFFCGCPLHCRYCQNYQISGDCEIGFQRGRITDENIGLNVDANEERQSKRVAADENIGINVDTNELSQIMIELQNFGAASLNLVTGTHFVPTIIQALEVAKQSGFSLPVVWNSSGYETVETLRLIDPYIDLYLFDVKTLDKRVASKFCGLEKYTDFVLPAVNFLKRRHPKTDLENSLSGVLIRHLVFPDALDATLRFLDWYADNLKNCCKLSLMTQFVPPLENQGFNKMTDLEYATLEKVLDRLDIDGFIQERDENEILWIPDFHKDQPFPDGFAESLPYFLELKINFLNQLN